MVKKCKEWIQKSTLQKKILIVVMALVLCFGGVLVVQAVTAPTAKIVSYADKSSTGLRVAQMLEVQTSNFANNAKLEYEYSWSNGWSLFPYNVSTSPDTAYHSYAYGDRRFIAISGAKSSNETLTVKVKDTNPKSATYGKTATASYKNFKAADLSKDISAGSYGMFVGESEELLYLLGKGGVLHITCTNSTTESCTLKSGSSISVTGTGNETTFTADKVGEARCMVTVKKRMIVLSIPDKEVLEKLLFMFLVNQQRFQFIVIRFF